MKTMQSSKRLLQKSLFVIPEVFIGNPVFFKIKDFWIPAFAGMTAKAVSSIHLQEAPKFKAQLANLLAKKLFGLFFAFSLLQFAFCLSASPAFGVPETTAVRIADVTTSSFSVVWMTDVAASPSVEVYAGNSLQQRITEGILITPMPAGSGAAAQAAQAKGIMKARVSGLSAATTYYVRTVTADPANAARVSYSSLQAVTTASNVALFYISSGTPSAFANDLAVVPVYIRPSDTASKPGLGDLVILEERDARYPVSAIVGDGALSPEGILDLNNLFGNDGSNLAVLGNEKLILRIYRAGTLSTLTHYRKAAPRSGSVSIVAPIRGFFADINLDSKIDDQDFGVFRALYRTVPDDMIYNPDYNFVDDPEGVVDVREFSKFSKEYGRTDAQ